MNTTTATTATATTATTAPVVLTAWAIERLWRENEARSNRRGRETTRHPAAFAAFIARLTGAREVSRHIVADGVFRGCEWERVYVTPQGVEFGWCESGTAAWDGPEFFVK